MSNSNGSYPSTEKLTMEAFDKLPPSARAALANAVVNWATQPILTKWRHGTKGFKIGKEIAIRIAEWDAKQIAKWVRRR